MELNCFVAMAIGRSDTDRLFEKGLRVALRRAIPGARIKAVRVDKIEHNNNIDAQILELVRKCDFVIADLTHARQSVYFEAGYAERKVPVIYTCRRDHLGAPADDAHDQRRVHFDLQMRNIIPWTRPNDAAFRKRLESRLRHVVGPLARQRESSEQRLLIQREFAKKSPLEQLELLNRILWVHIARRVRLVPGSFSFEPPIAWYLDGSTVHALLFQKRSHATPREVVEMCESMARDIEHRLLDHPLVRLRAAYVRASLVLYSPRPLSTNRLTAVHPYAAPTETGGIQWERELSGRAGARCIASIDFQAIGSVKSAPDLLEAVLASRERASFYKKVKLR